MIAWVVESTKSSCSPYGNAAHSSITSCANSLFLGAKILPDSNRGATELTLACLSFPRFGVKSATGIPIRLNSKINGSPAALASIKTVSGFQY